MDQTQRLVKALRGGDLRAARDAISKGADPNHVGGGRGLSPLYFAAASGDAQLVSLLLETGARPAAEKGEATSLHAAAGRGDCEMIQLLLRGGAWRLINRLDSDGCTPLMRAVAAGRIEAAKLLLEKRANVNERDGEGNTALRIAAADGTPEMAKLLLSAGADPLIPGRMGLSALDRARERRTPEGRMITVLFARHLEAAHASPRS